jgi:hypothetical protein
LRYEEKHWNEGTPIDFSRFLLDGHNKYLPHNKVLAFGTDLGDCCGHSTASPNREAKLFNY